MRGKEQRIPKHLPGTIISNQVLHGYARREMFYTRNQYRSLHYFLSSLLPLLSTKYTGVTIWAFTKYGIDV